MPSFELLCYLQTALAINVDVLTSYRRLSARKQPLLVSMEISHRKRSSDYSYQWRCVNETIYMLNYVIRHHVANSLLISKVFKAYLQVSSKEIEKNWYSQVNLCFPPAFHRPACKTTNCT